MPVSCVNHGSDAGRMSGRRAPHMTARVCSAITIRASRSAGSPGVSRGRSGMKTSTRTSAVAAAARAGASQNGVRAGRSVVPTMATRSRAGAGWLGRSLARRRPSASSDSSE